MTPRRRVLAISSVLALGLSVSACGSQGIEENVKQDQANVSRGATLFAERCSGCHTMKVVGAEGGATRIHDRERVDGPTFDVRREDVDSVLYAIRNGGFSGAIMPENIVVGKDAADVAAFLAKYAGGPRRGNDITPESQDQAAGGSSTGSQTTSTAESTTPTSTGESTTPTSTGEQTTSTGETTQGGGTQQASAQGKQVFTQNCAGCHTLKDANATGQIGPNLDQVTPDAQSTQRQVENGGGSMPAFKGRIPDSDIQAVSEYVASVAGKQ
jgi:mono/diheme cytochrome c family protein